MSSLVSYTREIRRPQGNFVEVQRYREELEKQRRLLSEVVGAMRGRFRVPSSSGSELLVSRLEGLAGRFKELEAESFCEAFVVAMSHFEGGSG